MLLVIHLHCDLLEAITLKGESVVHSVYLPGECREEHECGIGVIRITTSVSMAPNWFVCFQALVRFLTFNVCRQLLDMGGLLSVIHMEFVALNMDDFLDIVRLLSDDLLVITESVENRWTLLIKIGIRNLLKEL